MIPHLILSLVVHLTLSLVSTQLNTRTNNSYTPHLSVFSTRLNTRTNDSYTPSLISLHSSLYSPLDSTLELITSTTHLSASSRLNSRLNLPKNPRIELFAKIDALIPTLTGPSQSFAQQPHNPWFNLWSTIEPIISSV